MKGPRVIVEVSAIPTDVWYLKVYHESGQLDLSPEEAGELIRRLQTALAIGEKARA